MTVPGSIAASYVAARSRAEAALRAGKAGVELSQGLTADVEAVVIELASSRFAPAGLGGPSSGVAILATGGFGRREFAPYSDLDLMFLCAKSPGPVVERFAQSILYPLWDAKVDAGHAVRSVRDALELPSSDLTAATALLDARFLAGDRALGDHFLAKYAKRVAGSAPDGFVSRLRAEQRSRHSRFGDTIFLLEPDLKNGPGGVRDMCVGRWAALARFGTGVPRVLADLGEMSARQAEAFEAAREWLLRVRVGLHLLAGRGQDQLRFDFQEKLAPILYAPRAKPGGGARPAVAPAVEMLMRDFQRHAKTIRRETERLMLRAVVDPKHKASVRAIKAGGGHGNVDASFVLRDGEVEVSSPEVFEKQPAEMIRLFSVAIDRGAPVGLRTSDLVAEQAARAGVALRADSESPSRFFELLTDTRDTATPARLEQMQDLGLLAALIPEWEPVTGRVQHDLYHVYTVDQHSLYTVAMLKALARGDHADAYAQPSAEVRAVADPKALYLAALLHDIGKATGHNHSVNGAVVGADLARRFGLPGKSVRHVEFLIRQHLVMGHTSQRRDMEDPDLVARLALLCGDEDGLRDLYLLSFADMACIGPGSLTKWKDALLRELFLRTQGLMRRGREALLSERATVTRQRQAEAARGLGEDARAPQMAELFASFPQRYFGENDVDRIVAHIKLLRRRQGACAVEITPQPQQGFTEVVLVAKDVPGLLARVAGVFFANRIDIMDAAIYSPDAAPGASGRGEAVDIFRVRKAPDGGIVEGARIDSLRRDLEAVLGGQTTVEALLADHPVAPSQFERSKPEVPPTEVKVDNSISKDLTVLDVFTQDRPGVLYAIARVLHDQGLDIHWSKVATEADRVADIFYVRDKATGEKIVDTQRLETLCAALHDALPDQKD